VNKKALSERDICTKYITPAVVQAGWDGEQARTVLESLLLKYQDEGVSALDVPRVLKVAPFDAMGTPMELLNAFGGRVGFERAVHELMSTLYGKVA
jgi:type I restriction enzyme R subunit